MWPICAPKVVADAILYAAENPVREMVAGEHRRRRPARRKDLAKIRRRHDEAGRFLSI